MGNHIWDLAKQSASFFLSQRPHCTHMIFMYGNVQGWQTCYTFPLDLCKCHPCPSDPESAGYTLLSSDRNSSHSSLELGARLAIPLLLFWRRLSHCCYAHIFTSSEICSISTDRTFPQSIDTDLLSAIGFGLWLSRGALWRGLQLFPHIWLWEMVQKPHWRPGGTRGSSFKLHLHPIVPHVENILCAPFSESRQSLWHFPNW